MALADLTRINTNIGAMNALNSLKLVNNDLALRQLRLATGVRITKAADDPAGFRISVKLKARSRGLGVALDNISDAKNMLSVAEGGLTKIKDLLLDIRDKISQAANDTMGTEERLAIAQQVREYMHEIVRIAHETRWNDIGLLDDSKPADTTSSASTTFKFQTGADSFETTTWDRQFKFVFNNGTITNDESIWTDWAGNADKLGIMITTADDTTTAVSAKVYDSTQGLTPASAQFTVADVYASLGVAGEAGISGVTDSNNVNASANVLLQKVDAAIRKTSEWIAGIGALQARLQAKEETVMIAQVNVEASWNRIYNADMAKEQLYATRDQILQQTATAMLAQANTAPQSVLQLFR
ncbi:flagellin protein [bacterium 3DAC]|nr:flagellin protein [bacterium 3DAC]